MASVFKRGGKKAKGYYYAAWTDHHGKRVTRCTRTTDKATAERIASKHEAEAALRREGVIDATLEATSKEARRPIAVHLDDFERKLRTAGRTEKHIFSTRRFVEWIANDAGFLTPAEITINGVNRYACRLRDEGRAARTIQAHLSAIKAFTKWLTDHHKLPRDPLSAVKKPNPKADRRRERRILLPDEWRRLEKATAAGPDRFGMPAAERLLLYRTAIQTGLRSAELRSLTQGGYTSTPTRPASPAKRVRPRIGRMPASTSSPSWRRASRPTSRPSRPRPRSSTCPTSPLWPECCVKTWPRPARHG